MKTLICDPPLPKHDKKLQNKLSFLPVPKAYSSHTSFSLSLDFLSFSPLYFLFSMGSPSPLLHSQFQSFLAFCCKSVLELVCQKAEEGGDGRVPCSPHCGGWRLGTFTDYKSCFFHTVSSSIFIDSCKEIFNM